MSWKSFKLQATRDKHEDQKPLLTIYGSLACNLRFSKINIMSKSKKLIVLAGLTAFMVMAMAAMKRGKDDFKNLQVLPKNISVDSLNDIMNSYKHALGVNCGFCHVMKDKNGLEDYASDSIPHKNMARNMMRMTMDINKKYFPSPGMKYIETVTCNTCHKGRSEPE